ncbi:MAG TPA: tetratricopeptide repeat-containing glycosyltransferase family protein [Burkholderiales bacterium]|jgi:tetratricopeptide (TPR) repeat protein
MLRAMQSGREHHQAGRLPEAARFYGEVLQTDPNHPEALHLLGSVALQSGNHEMAIRLLDMAVRNSPSNPSFLGGLGDAYRVSGRLTEALANYDKSLAIKPDSAAALGNRGAVLQALGRFEEALACYDKALTVNPAPADVLCNRGTVLSEFKRYDEALACYDRALAINPGFAEAWICRGTLLGGMVRWEEGLASYDKALAIAPDNADLLNSRGNALREVGRYEEAVASYDKAAAIRPDYAEPWNGRGNALRVLGRYHEALASYGKAQSIKPDFAGAHWNESMCRLLLGDFERGWQKYEWRWRCDEALSVKRDFSRPLWLGKEDIAGKTILLYAEQGLGDAIQFARYTQAVADKGARVILEVWGAVKPLLSGFPGAQQVIGNGEPLPEFDFHCPLLSLPLALNTRLETIPAAIPYLRASDAKLDSWRRKLGRGNALNVGIAWSGRPEHRNDRNRSLALSALMAADNDGVRLISLQKEVRPEDASVLESNKRILHFGAELEDFSDTAALVSLVDLVISVDTSIAHLAGALGKPVWILLPFAPDWRWLLDREDSPWYPTARLFRQPRFGDWDDVIGKVKRELMTARSREAT